MEVNTPNQGAIRAEVLGLIKQKEKIESEIRELTGILTQNGVGMSEPLVDPEGFPISSIDTYQVRHARHRIICLQNDHKALMKGIEQGLWNRDSPGHSKRQLVSPTLSFTYLETYTYFARLLRSAWFYCKTILLDVHSTLGLVTHIEKTTCKPEHFIQIRLKQQNSL